MRRLAAFLAPWCGAALLLVPVARGAAQVRVSPTGLSTNAMNPSTVFLTFGGLRNQRPEEGIWCGQVQPATPPAVGRACDPNTIYGRLPLRSDLSQLGANGTFTDIMAIPASVTRRAYLSTLRGETAMFFYVRRFSSLVGGPDEFVAVTCRLTGGGAGVPFALTDVTVGFDADVPLLQLNPGDSLPRLAATIRYNGTGVLRGRWEVVLPGEELPGPEDLLTEATLPLAERGEQRRYLQVERFNVVLPPGGSATLAGPDPARLPRDLDGTYHVLLRIEASDDKFGDSDPGTVGGASGLTHTGAVAGFPMPMLRYVVGSGVSAVTAGAGAERVLLQLLPRPDAQLPRDSAVTVRWTTVREAALYRVEFETDAGLPLLTALVRKGTTWYVAPPVMVERAGTARRVRWRVSALDAGGAVQRRTDWRRFLLP